MRTTVVINNLKCNDCERSVKHIFATAVGISDVSIDASIGKVTFNYKTHNAMEGLRTELIENGFPITTDSTEMLNNSIAKTG